MIFKTENHIVIARHEAIQNQVWVPGLLRKFAMTGKEKPAMTGGTMTGGN